MMIRIEFPFFAQFEFPDPGNLSRELRTIALQQYLYNSGMELGKPVEDFQVTQFNGEPDGEFWTVKAED
jgi:hypothetical protein